MEKDIGVKIINSEDVKWQGEFDYFECTKCGFHLGLDSTYLQQVSDIKMNCPACKNKIVIKGMCD